MIYELCMKILDSNSNTYVGSYLFWNAKYRTDLLSKTFSEHSLCKEQVPTLKDAISMINIFLNPLNPYSQKFRLFWGKVYKGLFCVTLSAFLHASLKTQHLLTAYLNLHTHLQTWAGHYTTVNQSENCKLACSDLYYLDIQLQQCV